MAINPIPTARSFLSFAVTSFVVLDLLVSGLGFITYGTVQLLRFLPCATSFAMGAVLSLAGVVIGAVADQRRVDA